MEIRIKINTKERKRETIAENIAKNADRKNGENKLKAKELLSDMSSHLQFFAIIPSQWKMEIVKTNARTQYDNNNDRDNG